MKITRVFPENAPGIQLINSNNQASTSKSLKSNNLVDLSFENIEYSVRVIDPKSQQKENKPILKGLTGICPGGQVTAILGSSGAGKTTLLNILACRVPKTSESQLRGKVLANHQEYDYEKFCLFASYIMQNDILMETMTPKEAFTFAASMKFSDPTTQMQRVTETLKSMKLEKCQNALIGGITFKGISGGERKRTSIGYELVSNPACILLDEPTSGLDSFTAFAIINELKQLASQQDRTVIFTIHSPSTDIFQLFDRIMLLVGGKFIYQGQKSNIIDHFQNMGFTCPQSSNPMDYYLSLMQVDNLENQKHFNKMFQYYDQNCYPNVMQQIISGDNLLLPLKVREISQIQQIKQIANRNLLAFTRDPLQFYIRIFQTIVQGLLLGGVFWKVADNEGSVSDLMGISGSLFFCVFNLVISAVLAIILTFPVEREIFLREESSKLYSISSYFIAKQILEIPLCIVLPILQELISYWMCGYHNTTEAVIMHMFVSILIYNWASGLGMLVGCIFSDLKAILGIAPYTLLPYVLFSGFFANPKFFYSWTRWIQYTSPITYSFEVLSRVEFKDQLYEVDPIDLYDFKFGTWTCIYVLIGFIFLFRIFAFMALYILKSKLQ
ncbi:unnamed protein product [Paramecium octaurelia]|uniref:ABC transporter domain-containing protein n=1 Tax=Paramecium octaurelia TaxID=43137 RepID=A0A8S1X5K6_PAROT|nr:unnamed protein product [Paramecium octaurelia]